MADDRAALAQEIVDGVEEAAQLYVVLRDGNRRFALLHGNAPRLQTVDEAAAAYGDARLGQLFKMCVDAFQKILEAGT